MNLLAQKESENLELKNRLNQVPEISDQFEIVTPGAIRRPKSVEKPCEDLPPPYEIVPSTSSQNEDEAPVTGSWKVHKLVNSSENGVVIHMKLGVG